MFYNILLMAGEGQRFKKAGFKTPKALLPYNKKLMFQAAMEKFPDCDKWIFAVSSEVYDSIDFQKFIKNFNEDFEVVKFSSTTNGQATTCMNCLDLLEDEDSFFVGACDTVLSSKINKDSFLDKDTVLLVSDPTELQIKNLLNFGWVSYQDNEIKIYCKEEPLEGVYKSQIILGFFYFSTKKDYLISYKEMINNNMYINNELYIDVLIKNQIYNNLVISTLETNSIVLGTPNEYKQILKNNEKS